MAKRRREKVSEDAISAEEFYTAFIDTSLGTHLAMIISSSDTVSDLKEKIVVEHSQLFPRIGEIKVLSLQVKRKGHFYHLPDSMLVLSAYEGPKRHKFLYVNASSSEEHDREQHSSQPDAIGHMPLLRLENGQFNEHNLLCDDPSKQMSFIHGSTSAKIPNAVPANPRNFRGEISKAIGMEVSHIDDDSQKDLYLPLKVSKDISDDNAMFTQLETLDELSPEPGLAAKKQKTEPNETGVSNSVHMKRNRSDYEIVNIETAVVDGKSIPGMVGIREKEVNKNLCKNSSSHINKIAKAGAPKTSQSEPASQKSHNIGTKKHVGDNSDSSNWKEVTKPAKCTTDRQKNIFSSNVTSEQLKDDQPSLGSKKPKKKSKRTSVLPSEPAAICRSTSIQNIEEAQNFSGNLEIGCQVLNNLSDSVISPVESIQLETSSRPSVVTKKGADSNFIDEVVEGKKRACSLEGNVLGKMSAIDETAILGVNGKMPPTKLQAANVEDFASQVNIGINDMMKVTSQACDENIHLGSLDFVAFQTDGKGHKEVELNHEDEVMPSEMCKPSDEGNADEFEEAPILMPKRITSSGPMETVTSDGTKRNKTKRTKEKALAMQTDSITEQTNMKVANPIDGPNLNAGAHTSDKTDKNEGIIPLTENYQSTKVEEERGLSSNLDPQGKTSEYFKLTDCGEAGVPTKEAGHSSDFLGSNEVLYDGNSTIKKRKKRKTKNSAAKVQGISEMENTINGISLSVQDIALSNQMRDYDNKRGSNVPCMGAVQTSAILGEKGLSMEQGTKVTSPMGPKPLHLGETNSNNNEIATTPMLSEAKDVKSRSRRKKRRTQKSAIINQDDSEMELVNTSKGLSALSDSPVINVAAEIENSQSIRSRIVWKDESMDASASGSHKKGDKVTWNEAVLLPPNVIDQSQEDRGDIGENGRQVLKNNQSLTDNGINDLPVEGQNDEVQGPQLNQSGRSKENYCNTDKRAKKKNKRNQISAAEVLANSDIKDLNLVGEELAASGDKRKGMDSPSGARKTSQLAKRGTIIQSTACDLEIEKHAGTESNISNPEHAPKDTNPFEVPLKRKPETEIDAGNNNEISKGKDEGINFRRYFVPGQHQDKVVPLAEVKEKLQSVKPKRKKEKHNVVAASQLEASENLGNQNKSDGINVDDNRVAESASSDEHNKVLLWGNKKASKASEDGVKDPSSREGKGDETFEKAIKPAVADDTEPGIIVPALLGENNGSLTASSWSSSSKVSKSVVSNMSKRKQQTRLNTNPMSDQNNSIKSARDDLNSSGQEKILLTTPRAIFREDSSESSSNENKIVNSDASTRTPSDSSSSSGYSVGESELSQDSKRNGSVNATRKVGGAGKILNTKFSGPGQMSLHMVLRSSNRFKKARHKASQSQAGDIEGQPIDFVPDSQQANQ